MGSHSHTHTFSVERFVLDDKTKKYIFGFIGAGLLLTIIGIIIATMGGHGGEHTAEAHAGHHGATWVTRLWANILLNNFYFVGIALLAVFFMALQHVSNAGWAVVLMRIPQAMGAFLIPGAILMLLVAAYALFGHSFYHWTDSQVVAADPILSAKSAWLNKTGFVGRMVVYFLIWIFFYQMLSKISNSMDNSPSLEGFNKGPVYGSLFTALFALSISASSWDWIMSIEAHWFSTMFSVYSFAGSFVGFLAMTIIIVSYLKSLGYLGYVSESHLHDLGKFLFAFCTFWAYIWFCQFLLIWYANIPEEGIYFARRWENGYKPYFFLDAILSWVLPFLILMTRNSKRNTSSLVMVAVIVLIGHYTDLFMMVMPGAVGAEHGEWLFSPLELGVFLTYMGIFWFVTAKALEKCPLAPKYHPYLEESLHHTT